MNLNKPLIAILLSILGAIPAGIFIEIMKYFHLTTLNAFEGLSMMFIRQGSWTLGILAYMGYSAVLGLVLYYGSQISGTDYFPIKSMFISMLAEAIFYIIFGTLPRNEFLIQNASGNYVFASTAAIGGLCRGFLMKKYLFDHNTVAK